MKNKGRRWYIYINKLSNPRSLFKGSKDVGGTLRTWFVKYILKTKEGQDIGRRSLLGYSSRLWGTDRYKAFRINLSTIVPNYSFQCLLNHEKCCFLSPRKMDFYGRSSSVSLYRRQWITACPPLHNPEQIRKKKIKASVSQLKNSQRRFTKVCY